MIKVTVQVRLLYTASINTLLEPTAKFGPVLMIAIHHLSQTPFISLYSFGNKVGR